MDFGAALDGLRAGMPMRRESWKDVSFVAIVDGPIGTKPRLAIVDGDEWNIGWIVSHDDILADDWQEFNR